MERVALDADRSQLFIGNLDSRRVLAGIDFGTYSQPGPGGGSCDEIYDHLMTDQRFATPVLTDERE